MRFPRRFAPRNDTGGRHSQARRCAPPNGKGPQVCHCEPCGARRGNLAVPAGARESPGEVEGAYLRLPRRACALLAMTREGSAAEVVIARLRRSKARQSRSTRPEYRKASGELVAAFPRLHPKDASSACAFHANARKYSKLPGGHRGAVFALCYFSFGASVAISTRLSSALLRTAVPFSPTVRMPSYFSPLATEFLSVHSTAGSSTSPVMV